MKLLDYIRGLRKGKDAHRLEKESMKDPFLADAMDGYQQIEGKHEERIKKLQARITTRSTKNRNSYAITWSIAACLIIGIGISSYFLFLKSNMPEDTFIAKETTHTTTLIPETPIAPDTLEEKITRSSSTTKVKQDSVRVVTPDIEIKRDRFAKSKVTSTPKKVSTKIAVPIKEEIIESAIAEKEENTTIAMDTSLFQSNEKDIMKVELTANTKNVIKGMVIDDKGKPLIGANITYVGKRAVTDDKEQSRSYGSLKTYEGKSHATITDINGKFSIPKNQLFGKLEVNYIGYDPVSIIVKDSIRPLLIAMKESTRSKFDEVVITGTGAQKKMTITGAITSVNVEELKRAPHTNALAGNVAGVISKEPLENLVKSTSDSLEDISKENLEYRQHRHSNALAGSISKENLENLIKASKQIMPKPVIGMKQYQKYLKKNLIQPKDETCSGIKGIVTLTFLINEKGRPFQIKIKKGLCESADKEAIRLIQEGPDWTHGNKPVEIKVKFK